VRALLTFDVEVWCNTWSDLDSVFPQAFERYVYGSSRGGQFALPKTLEILRRNGLHGVFFVEPLFAARFGLEYLRTIVELIQDAGQEVQLHLHPEWTDEISPPPLPNATAKRQHLRYYTLEEQTTLIALGARLLQDAGAPRPTAFRAGNFAANADTFLALAANDIWCDSSIDATMPDSVPDLRDKFDLYGAREIAGVSIFPVAVFEDGLGQLRHAQIGACSARELVQAMQSAREFGWSSFVVLSHNFEMLKVKAVAPDWVVVKRFEVVCEYLARHREELPTGGFEDLHVRASAGGSLLPKVGMVPTMRRYAEQALRRCL